MSVLLTDDCKIVDSDNFEFLTVSAVLTHHTPTTTGPLKHRITVACYLAANNAITNKLKVVR
jgi:hypothetical protein